MAEDRNILIEDEFGNAYYPHGKSEILFMNNGESIEEYLKKFIPDTNNIRILTRSVQESELSEELLSTLDQGIYLFKMSASGFEFSDILYIIKYPQSIQTKTNETVVAIHFMTNGCIQYKFYDGNSAKWTSWFQLSNYGVSRSMVLTGSLTLSGDGSSFKEVNLGFEPRYIRLLIYGSKLVTESFLSSNGNSYGFTCSDKETKPNSTGVIATITKTGFEIPDNQEFSPIHYIAIR